MSNPHDDSNKEPIKPISKGLKVQVQRIVSAGATLESTVEAITTNTLQSNPGGESEISKLRITATPFVPKNRRVDGASTTTKPTTETETKETLNTTNTSTTTNVSSNLNPMGVSTGAPSSNYPSSKNFNKINYFSKLEGAYGPQQSYIPYTYLNPTPMYPTHVQPHMPIISPNKVAGGQFFGGYNTIQGVPPMTMPPTIQYGQYPMYPNQPKYTPMGPTHIATPSTSTITTQPTITTTATNYASLDTKKSSFNKYAQPFYPKSFKHDATPTSTQVESEQKVEAKVETISENKVPEYKPAEIIEQIKKETLPPVQVEQSVKQVQPVVKEAEISVSVEEVKEIKGEVNPPLPEESKTSTITTPSTTTTTPTVTEPPKPEKKTKLDNLFDSAPTSTKAKTQVKDVKKVEKPAATIPASTKPKQGDKNKYFEEMSKKLQKQQALQEIKPKPVTQQKRETTEKETPLEDGERKFEEPQTTLTEEKEMEEVKTVAETETKIEQEEISKVELESELSERVTKQTIERHYFLVNENKENTVEFKKVKHIYSVDYMLSLKDWKICREDKLLTDMLKDHIKLMNTVYEEERQKGYKSHSKRESKPMTSRQSTDMTNTFQRKPEKEEIKRQSSTTTTTEGLQRWGRKDMSEAERMAQEFKTKLEEERKRDPVRNDLIELLNILTVDNYDEVKKQIYDKIKDDVEDQGKFLEVIFKKAVNEKAFVFLYSRLCKDLDKELPQKSEKVAERTTSGKLATRPSIMRSKLLEKCKEIFKTDQDSKVDQYIKVSDPEEREAKMKKFLLGNVNFIGELINTKLLSKRIVFQCLNNLFSRIEKSDELNAFFRLINIEAIVILMDKFGTLISKYDTKTNPDEIVEFSKKIDEYLKRLEIIESDKNIPGHIKYKIINLIEKRNRGWEESKVDKTVLAQGKNQIKEEYESEQRGSISGKSGMKLDQQQVNSKIREDLYNWREHLKSGYGSNDFPWEITETLVKKNKNTIGEILTAFSEACIDFTGNKEDVKYAYQYIREVISYFFKRLHINEKNEINQVAFFWLENISDISLDNNLLVNIWGGVIYLLDFYGIFSYKNIDELTNLSEDQLKAIFEVIKYALDYFEDEQKEQKKNELLNIPLIIANKALFQSIV